MNQGKALVRVRWVHATDGAFSVRSVDVSLDDRPVFHSKDENALEQAMVPLVDVEIEPGTHELGTKVHVIGHGYGVFAFLNDYKRDLEQGRSFNATAGSASCFSLFVSYDGAYSTPVTERPQSVIIEQRPR